MQCELTCRLTPLPGLLRKAAIMCKGTLQAYFNMLAEELENQIAPDVSCCVEAALDRCGELPQKVRRMLKLVGQTLGRFDLDGQIKGLENTYRDCERICSEMEVNRPQRLRSYPTLGLCIGVVLAILFL
jgi:stage III sporulation protein AB